MAEEYERGRLLSRPARAPAAETPVGLHAPGTEAGPAEVYLYVPAGHRKEAPSPLALLLHGAGEDARDGLAQMRGQADEAGLILLALGSRGPTWDLILNRGRYGADVAAIDRALGHAFSRCAVDPARVGVGDTRTGPPTPSLSGWPTATSSRTSSPSPRGFWRRRARWVRRASSFRTEPGTGGSRSTPAAAG